MRRPLATRELLAVGLLGAILLSSCASPAPRAGDGRVLRVPPGQAWRVAILGDSVENQVAPELATQLQAAGVAKVVSRTFAGESFCSSWANHRAELLAFKPDVLLVQGVGDPFSSCALQPPYPASADDPTWTAVLGQQLLDASNELRGLHPVQVLLDAGPITSSPQASSLQERTRRRYAELARAHPGFLSAINPGAAVLDAQGRYVTNLPCLAAERRAGRCTGTVEGGPGTIAVRAPDGFHFCLTPPPANTWTPPGCSSYSSGIVRYAAAQAKAVVEHLGR